MSEWETFYVIVGSSGGALIGLQFVVITLIADRQLASSETLAAFGTPTVVHLAGALIVSAVMSAPWPSHVSLSVALTACGISGLAYGIMVIRRALKQTGYEPVWEDWLWYAALPCTAYGVLALAPAFLHAANDAASFIIAGAALGLLLIGIHNAWDSVTHVVVTTSGDEKK